MIYLFISKIINCIFLEIAWLTAAVDKRVIGAIPVVMDILNLQKVELNTD